MIGGATATQSEVMDRQVLSPFEGFSPRGDSPGDGGRFSPIDGAESPVGWQSDEEDLFGRRGSSRAAGREGGGGRKGKGAPSLGREPVAGKVRHASEGIGAAENAGVGRGGEGAARTRRQWMVGAGLREQEEALEREVLQLDAKYRQLVRQGRLVEASEHLEQSLFSRVKMFGAHSAEVEKAARALVTHCNTGGMMALQAGNFSLALQQLRKADVLTSRHGALQSAEAAEARRRLRAVMLLRVCVCVCVCVCACVYLSLSLSIQIYLFMYIH